MRGLHSGVIERAMAHLVSDGIEEGGLVGGFEVFDRVVVLEHAPRLDGDGRDAVSMMSRIDRGRWGRTWVCPQRHLRRGRDCILVGRPGRFRDL